MEAFTASELRSILAAAGAVHVQGGQRRRGRGPTKNPHSVRKVSVLHPTTEDRAIWHPQDAGNATRRVLDGLALLTALAHDAESRLWPISATRLDRISKKVLKAAGLVTAWHPRPAEPVEATW